MQVFIVKRGVWDSEEYCLGVFDDEGMALAKAKEQTGGPQHPLFSIDPGKAFEMMWAANCLPSGGNIVASWSARDKGGDWMTIERHSVTRRP